MKRSKVNGRFIVCIRNEECEDLEPRKLYRVPDEAAAADGYIRVIDESGEDYLYPQNFFLPSSCLKPQNKPSYPRLGFSVRNHEELARMLIARRI
ncbi:MAG TPA: hypothetical protein VNO50_07960 [Pyrinomonadaceae bacterium]|nr:hypothetical protein [Pyrinomonadaceae bacterium]